MHNVATSLSSTDSGYSGDTEIWRCRVSLVISSRLFGSIFSRCTLRNDMASHFQIWNIDIRNTSTLIQS